MSNSVFHKIYEEKINSATNLAQYENFKTLTTLKTSFLTTVLSTFKWKKIPKTITKRNPEMNLCYWGLMAMFKDDNGELKIYPAYPSGALKENGEYERYTMVAYNGKTWSRSREEIALCYNNIIGIPSIYMINELTEKANFALRAVDNALERSMIPAIIECDTPEDMARISDLYDRNKNQLPFRLTYREGLKASGSVVNDIFDSRKYDMLQMWDVYVRYRNLFYTTFGTNNIEIQKRERLTEAEGSGNDEITRYTLLQDMYDRRMDFVEECKEKFDYEIEFEVNRDSATVYNLELDNEDKIDDTQLNLMRGINPQEKTEENDGDEETVKETDDV